jgi:hypothetical protein
MQQSLFQAFKNPDKTPAIPLTPRDILSRPMRGHDCCVTSVLTAAAKMAGVDTTAPTS